MPKQWTMSTDGNHRPPNAPTNCPMARNKPASRLLVAARRLPDFSAQSRTRTDIRESLFHHTNGSSIQLIQHRLHSHKYNLRSRRHNLSLSLLKLMTGILLLDSYSVTPISIFNISPSLSSQLRTAILLEQYMFILIVVAMRLVIAFIKPIL